MLLNLTQRIEKLCTHCKNIVIYNQFGLDNMLSLLIAVGFETLDEMLFQDS